jgi:hypothetical protein
VKTIVRTLKKKLNAAKTSKLIFNNAGLTKNFKQSLKLLNYLEKIRFRIHRTYGKMKKPALKIKDQMEKTKNGLMLKLSCSSSPSNYTVKIGKKFQKL